MTPHSFAVSLSLMFWGWQMGYIWLTIPMILVVESERFSKSKWNFTQSDFNRVADICTVILAGIIIFTITAGSRRFIIRVLQWMPMAVFPLLVAQLYSTSEKIDISTFFIIARKKAKKTLPKIAIDLNIPYFFLCIFSAGAANTRSHLFYISILILLALYLWPIRSNRYPIALWFFLLFICGSIGYVGYNGLSQLQRVLTRMAINYFFFDSDPYQRTTSIGDIGEIKLSDKIVFRIKPETDPSSPILIREASYNMYHESTWFAVPFDFKNILPELDEAIWKFGKSPQQFKTMTVSSYLSRGKGMLKLPNNAFRLENLPSVLLKKNQFGAVKVEDGPYLITYPVQYGNDNVLDQKPTKEDLQIHEEDKVVVKKVIENLSLISKTPEQVLSIVKSYFYNNFKYSLNLERQASEETPLADFLFHTKSGHCEYFATSTVLLLREAGIPARYATGYVAGEYSRLENNIIVRARHAHAWPLVYVDGRWHDFDTTPPSWFVSEASSASKMNLISDFISFIRFRYYEWLYQGGEINLEKYVIWLLLPLGFIIIRQFYGGKKIKRVSVQQNKVDDMMSVSGADSNFYLIEKRLIELGYERHPWETFPVWIKRIETKALPSLTAETLEQLLKFHYRLRFDSKELTSIENEKFTVGVSEALNRIESN